MQTIEKVYTVFTATSHGSSVIIGQTRSSVGSAYSVSQSELTIIKSKCNRSTNGPEYIEPGSSRRPVRSPIAMGFRDCARIVPWSLDTSMQWSLSKTSESLLNHNALHYHDAIPAQIRETRNSTDQFTSSQSQLNPKSCYNPLQSCQKNQWKDNRN